MLRTEKHLNAIVARCARILGAGARRDWLLGEQLNTVKEEGLWKLRRDHEGNQRYHYLRQFAQHELGVTEREITVCLRVYNAFDSSEDVRDVKSPVAYAVANVRNVKLRHKLIKESRGKVAAFALDAVDALPNAALFFPRKQPGLRRSFQFSMLANFLTDHPKARLVINVRADGTFACAFTAGKTARVAHSRVLAHAVMEACAGKLRGWENVSRVDRWKRQTFRRRERRAT